MDGYLACLVVEHLVVPHLTVDRVGEGLGQSPPVGHDGAQARHIELLVTPTARETYFIHVLI